MIGYIYITTNLINGKKYIGLHESPIFNPGYHGSGKIIKQAYEKYGYDNFKTELIQEYDTFEELNEAEKYWIKYYDAVHSKDFYNIAYGGKNNPAHPLSEDEVEQRRQQMLKRWKSEDYQRQMSEMLHEKQKDGKSWMIGKKHTEETKAKMSESHRGEKHHMYGKHQLEETCKKISDTKKGIKPPPQCTTAGRIWIHKGTDNKSILPEDFELYEKEGYVKGRYMPPRKKT